MTEYTDDIIIEIDDKNKILLFTGDRYELDIRNEDYQILHGASLNKRHYSKPNEIVNLISRSYINDIPETSYSTIYLGYNIQPKTGYLTHYFSLCIAQFRQSKFAKIK